MCNQWESLRDGPQRGSSQIFGVSCCSCCNIITDLTLHAVLYCRIIAVMKSTLRRRRPPQLWPVAAVARWRDVTMTSQTAMMTSVAPLLAFTACLNRRRRGTSKRPRWTRRADGRLSVCLSVSLSLCLSVSLSVAATLQRTDPASVFAEAATSTLTFYIRAQQSSTRYRG